MSSKEVLVEDLIERCLATGLSAHEMLGLMCDMTARCALRYGGVRGGTTVVARE